MQDANTIYDGLKPWASMQEHEVSGQLKEQTTLSTSRIESLKPPIPNIGKTIARFGHGAWNQPTIQDVLRCDKLWAPTRVDYTGSQAGYAGTSYPALGVM
jgi:hypothetical protein